ncbi:MAG: DUF488 family protein [Actinomycetota bacterium]
MSGELFSIGHSNHSLERFVELISVHGIQAVADIRSHPSSRHAPHFQRAALERALRSAALKEVDAALEDPRWAADASPTEDRKRTP